MSATIFSNGKTMNNAHASQLPAVLPIMPKCLPKPNIGNTPTRMASDGSVASANFDDGDDYDDYDDFSPVDCRVGSGRGGGAGQSGKQKRREDNRGGSGGSGTIYSAKHIRTKESLRERKGKK